MTVGAGIYAPSEADGPPGAGLGAPLETIAFPGEGVVGAPAWVKISMGAILCCVFCLF